MYEHEKVEISKIEIPVFPGIKVNNPNIICLDSKDEYLVKKDKELDSNINYVEDDMFKTRVYNLQKADDVINCLKDILSVNRGVIIDKVTYSEENSVPKLTIYSNKELNTKYYENKFKIAQQSSRVGTYNTIKPDINTILEGINSILNEKQDYIENTVSVAELFEAFSLHIKIFTETEQSVIKDMNDIIYNMYDFDTSKIREHSIEFDFQHKKLSFDIYHYNGFVGSGNIKQIEFQLADSEQIIPIKPQSQEGLELYYNLKNQLSDFFKLYLENEALLNMETEIKVPTINSDYVISLNNKNICTIFYLEKSNKLLNIVHSVKNINEFTFTYNDMSLLKRVLLDKNLEKLYNNTFVKIEDCPLFLQEKLYNLKKNTELIPQSDEDELPKKETMKQKIKSFFTSGDAFHW